MDGDSGTKRITVENFLNDTTQAIGNIKDKLHHYINITDGQNTKETLLNLHNSMSTGIYAGVLRLIDSDELTEDLVPLYKGVYGFIGFRTNSGMPSFGQIVFYSYSFNHVLIWKIRGDTNEWIRINGTVV